MFTSDQDTERIIPRKRIDFLKIGTQVLAVVFLLLYIGYDLIAETLPAIPIIGYENLVIILLVLVFGMPVAINLFRKWLQTQKWLALAEEIGFQVEKESRFSLPTLQGTLRGHRMTLSQSSQNRGRRRTHFTNIKVQLNEPVSEYLTLNKRSVTNFNQHKIGDDEIDKRYTTQTNDERLIQTILRTRRLRLGLLQLGERARTRSLNLTQTTLSYIENGETADTEYLRAVMGFLSEMAHTAERHGQFDF